MKSELVHSSPLEGSSRTRYSFSGNVLPVLITMTLLMPIYYFRAPTHVQGSVYPVNSHLMTDLRYEIASWVGVGIISDRVNFLMRFQQKKKVREEVLPGNCCFHRGSTLKPGHRIPLPSKCSWLVIQSF